MKNKFIRKLMILFAACWLGACAKSADPSASGHGSPAEPAAVPSPGTSQGGADMGGCNGIQSRCFEDFIVRIDEREEFKAVVLPIFEKLKKLYPPMAADILHLTRERSWYFVPVELNQIPSRYLGVGFKTEQIALHTKKEIWVSTKHYESTEVTVKSRGLILVHELVMGIRFMEFQTSLDKCYAKAAIHLLDNDKEKGLVENRAQRSLCRSTYPNPLDSGKNLQVTESMNLNIRELTRILMTRLDEIDGDELKDWIQRHEFRAYD
jgi:hypothetical protein